MKEIKCKNKKCLKILPNAYKHAYCENCRNEHVNTIKKIGSGIFGVIVVLGSLGYRKPKN